MAKKMGHGKNRLHEAIGIHESALTWVKAEEGSFSQDSRLKNTADTDTYLIDHSLKLIPLSHKVYIDTADSQVISKL